LKIQRCWFKNRIHLWGPTG